MIKLAPRIPLVLALVLFAASAAQASSDPDEALYQRLSDVANGVGEEGLFATLNETARGIDFAEGSEAALEGNLRHLELEDGTDGVFLIRDLSGVLYVLALPADAAALEGGADSPYAGLDGLLQAKLSFELRVVERELNGHSYRFAELVSAPLQLALDRIFKILIIAMLFFVMAGMGLTLTLKDFALVFKKPLGMIIGLVLQFGVMPLVALALGLLYGFYESYPFIYVGMILVIVSPGGVTSNLMTHYAKGDLALSISLTSFSTLMSIGLTPLLLALYCANVPAVTIPVKTVVLTICIMVLIPLILGMSIRSKWEAFAKRAVPFFSALGIIALLFLIVTGLLANLSAFTDTERYGLAFYSMVFVLTASGMLVGAIGPKLTGINNYQTRAISLESGLRNASLSMTLALLLQDVMGDFHSSMFFVSGLFGLTMYVAGVIAIWGYQKLLPVDPAETAAAES